MSNNGNFLLQEMKNTNCNINCSRCSTWKDLTGLSWFNWQTWICLSVEQEAKLSSDFLGRWNWKLDNEKIKELPVHIKSWSRVKRKLLLAAPRCCVPDNRRPDNEKKVIDSLSQIIVFLVEMVKAGSTSQTNLSTPALRMKFPVLFHFKAKMGPCKGRI